MFFIVLQGRFRVCLSIDSIQFGLEPNFVGGGIGFGSTRFSSIHNRFWFVQNRFWFCSDTISLRFRSDFGLVRNRFRFDSVWFGSIRNRCCLGLEPILVRFGYDFASIRYIFWFGPEPTSFRLRFDSVRFGSEPICSVRNRFWYDSVQNLFFGTYFGTIRVKTVFFRNQFWYGSVKKKFGTDFGSVDLASLWNRFWFWFGTDFGSI